MSPHPRLRGRGGFFFQKLAAGLCEFSVRPRPGLNSYTRFRNLRLRRVRVRVGQAFRVAVAVSPAISRPGRTTAALQGLEVHR